MIGTLDTTKGAADDERTREHAKAQKELAQIVHSSPVLTRRMKEEQALVQAKRNKVEGWLNDVEISSHMNRRSGAPSND